MLHETVNAWRSRHDAELLVRPPNTAPRPAVVETADPPLSRETIIAYLAALGLDDIDPAREQIFCWASLQAFVAARIDPRSAMPPNNNTRLKTYGLEKSRVMTMFIRHVVF